MILKSKIYLIFQVTIPVVTFIVMFLYHIIQPASFVVESEVTHAAVIQSIYPTIIYSICSAISWKKWEGGNWYSLSIILFITLFILSLLIIFVSYLIDSYGGLIVFLFNLDLIVCFPASLLLCIVIGLVGHWCIRMKNIVHLF